jgi:hypothetical protein
MATSAIKLCKFRQDSSVRKAPRAEYNEILTQEFRKMQRLTPGWVMVWLGVAFVGWLLLDSFLQVKTLPPSAPDVESTSDRQQQMKAAFCSTHRPLKSVEFADFFRELFTKLHEQKPNEAVDAFDTDRMFAEAVLALPSQILPPETDTREAQVRVVQAIWRAVASGGWFQSTGAVEILLIDDRGGESTRILYTRHRLPNGDAIPMRWWLSRSGAKWQVYDLEDCRTGLRLTEQIAPLLLVPTREDQLPGLQKALASLQEASAKLALRETTPAKAILNTVPDTLLPTETRVQKWLLEAVVNLELDDRETVERVLTNLDKLRPGMPATRLMRATLRHREKQWVEVEREARAYVELLGPDRQASWLLADALTKLERKADASKIAQDALVVFPGDAKLLGFVMP